MAPIIVTINETVYYKIPGGRPTLDKHKIEVPLILYNKPLEEIMKFGDDYRRAGRTPCVILPSPALGGVYVKAWDNHADPSGLLDNVSAHIDGYIVDPVNVATPQVPRVWDQTHAAPKYIFWERLNQEVLFRGSHAQFKAKFGFDPEDPKNQAGDTDPGTGTGDTDTGGDQVIEISGSRIKSIKIPAFEISVEYEDDPEG